MKHHTMKINPLFHSTCTALLLLGIVVPSRLRAEPPTPTPVAPANPAAESPKVAPVVAASPDSYPKIDFNLGAQGSVGVAIEMLRENYPQYTYVLAPGISDLPLGELKLRSASLQQLANAIGVVGNGNVNCIADGGTLYVSLGTGKSMVMMEAFNIGPFMDSHRDKPEALDRLLADLPKMILETCDMMKEADPALTQGAYSAKFKFYPGAKLFIVVGTPDAIEVADHIIGALNGGNSSLNAGRTTWTGLKPLPSTFVGLSPAPGDSASQPTSTLPAAAKASP